MYNIDSGNKIYLKHLAGVTALLEWAVLWGKLVGPPEIKNNCLIIKPIVAQRFAIGYPQSKRFGKNPFLAIQKQEKEWAYLIPWNKIYFNEEQTRMILVSSKSYGEDFDLPNLTPMGISIPLDDKNKIIWLKKFAKIELRGLWFEENIPQIESGPSFATLNVCEYIGENELFSKNDFNSEKTFEDLIKERLEETAVYNNPGYNGNQVNIEDVDLKKLL